MRIPPEKLKAMAIERDRDNFQLAFHAIGDRANRIALDTFAAVIAANGERERRDRVEHAQIVALEDFARFAQMNVIASMQPSHLLDDERWATDRIGAQRVLGAYAWRTFEKLCPSFITTAASLSTRRFFRAASDSVPGTTVRTSSPQVMGVPAVVQQPDIPVTPGTTVTANRSLSRT